MGDELSFDAKREEQRKRLEARPASRAEMGVTGLKHSGGYVFEEFHPKLSGQQRIRTYTEMRANSPLVAAMLQVAEHAVADVEWRVEGDNAQSAEFVEQCLHDMSQSWAATTVEILSMLQYGYSMHEEVYKRRLGPQEGGQTSQYSDGKIGWRKMPIRAQSSIMEWRLDLSGGVEGAFQVAPPDYRRTWLPIEKCLLFRPAADRNNPEGRSMLRGAYRPWHMAKRLEEFEAIGIERNLAGLPVLELPAEIMRPDAPAELQQVRAAFMQMIVNLRRGEQEGVLLPQSWDGKGNPQYKLSLLAAGGGSSKVIDTNLILRRYYGHILMAMMADFLQLGHEGVGSYALGDVKAEFFVKACDAVATSIAEVMTRHAIPRLLKLNGFSLTDAPALVPGSCAPRNLEKIGAFLQQCANAGMTLFPDMELENALRRDAKLPEITEEAFAERSAGEQEQQAAERAALNKVPAEPQPPVVYLPEAEEPAPTRKQVTFTKDKDGKITGAEVVETSEE